MAREILKGAKLLVWNDGDEFASIRRFIGYEANKNKAPFTVSVNSDNPMNLEKNLEAFPYVVELNTKTAKLATIPIKEWDMAFLSQSREPIESAEEADAKKKKEAALRQ